MTYESDLKRQRQNTYLPYRLENARHRARSYNYANPMAEPATAEDLLDAYDYYKGWCFYCGRRALWTDGTVVCANGDKDNREPGNLVWTCRRCGKQKLLLDSGPNGPFSSSQFMDKKKYTYHDVREKWFEYWVRHFGDEDYEFGYLQYSPAVCDAWVEKIRAEEEVRTSYDVEPKKRKTYARSRVNPDVAKKIARVFGEHGDRYANAQDRSRRGNAHHLGQNTTAFDYYEVYRRGKGRCTLCGSRAPWDKGRVTNFLPLRGNPEETYAVSNLVWACASCAHKKFNMSPYHVMKGKLEHGNTTPLAFVSFCDVHPEVIPKGEGVFVEKQRSLIP